MDTERLNYLLKKYNSQTATPEEIRIVEDWYESVNAEVPEMSADELAGDRADILAQLDAHIDAISPVVVLQKNFLFRNYFLAKAAIFAGILLGLGYLFLLKPKPDARIVEVAKREITPGGNHAVLQLADGTKVVLNSASDGQISDQAGIEVTKTRSGELVYTMNEPPDTKVVRMNTVTTPRGGQYHLILVDKTEVWLNSGSSITFPTVFSGNDRKVTITGEAYFEVAKNKSKPFIVSTRQSQITVLGTHFNVNCYDDEETEATTLLEGAVKVTRQDRQLLLKPGQQATIPNNSSLITLHEVEDAESIIAWKNGYFQFENADLTSVMRQISRWFDTEVQYNGPVPVKQFNGKIPRNISAKELIEMLSYSGIHCKIQNNKIIVNAN